MNTYKDKSLSARTRAELLLAEMNIDEKILQVCSDMIRECDGVDIRDFGRGVLRSGAHFMHWDYKEQKTVPKTAGAAASLINGEVRRSIEKNSHGIPSLIQDEALHGAQWGMATCFPQPIALASSFDDDLVQRVADVIGKECRAVGVRQVLSPVVNVCRDSRWGRTVETFGEDVLLNSNLGAIMCRGFEKNGVIATPKHFVDNYADGGRDSNESHTSERALREIFLKPFEKCVKDGGAKSIMTAYNSIDGMPCACNGKLLQKILRDEWGFDGFVVCDYGGVEGIAAVHNLTDEIYKAQAFAMENGHDVTLPRLSPEIIRQALNSGVLQESTLDECVLRVLIQKFRIGLMDNPFVDEYEADITVRNEEARKLAYEAAMESIILLKNDNVLPLKADAIGKIGVFGAAANKLPIGENYSGPFGGWVADDTLTPFEALCKCCDGNIEVIFGNEGEAEKIASECDAVIYFTSVIEGEGMDRCDISLPNVCVSKQENDSAIIVDKRTLEILENQENLIKMLTKHNKNVIVVLLNGAPIDMSSWIDNVSAVVEAWYPGEQGGSAIAKMLFGEYSPSAKLPITFPRSVGQLPLYYSYRPSGRGYGYNENDGSPLYPFGYGLSYTKFDIFDCDLIADGDKLHITGKIKNSGDFDGAEILQVYVSGRNCFISRPIKELKGYRRVFVKKGETVDFDIPLDKESFHFYDAKMRYERHDCDYTVSLATSSDTYICSFEIKIREGSIDNALLL